MPVTALSPADHDEHDPSEPPAEVSREVTVPPAEAAANVTSPVAEALVVPASVAVAIVEGEGTDVDEEERVTNPGPPRPAWRDEENRGRNATPIESLAPRHFSEGLEYDDDTTAPRAPVEPNVLRARPRKTAAPSAPAETRTPVAPPAPRITENGRPELILRLDTPLFREAAFARPPAPRRPQPPRAAAPKPWIGWVCAVAIVVLLAVGWSALRSDASASTRRTRARGDSAQHDPPARSRDHR